MMKRQYMMKLLMLVVGVMIFMTLKADVVDPPPHILSYDEWTKEMSSIDSSEARTSDGFSAELIGTGVMILILVAVAIACGCGMPCLATRLPIPRVFRFMGRRNWRIVLVFVLVSLGLWWFVRWWFAPVFQLDKSIMIMGSAKVGAWASVEAKPGETYEEYRKRAIGIINHHCPKCDYPMRSGYNRGRYWYCTSCGYGTERHMQMECHTHSERGDAFSAGSGQ